MDKTDALPNAEAKSEDMPKHKTLRIVIAVIAAAAAVTAAVVFVTELVKPDMGWARINGDMSLEGNNFTDVALYYNVKDIVTNKAVTSIFQTADVDANRLLSSDREYDNYTNLAYLNAHPNTVFTVDAILYDALKTVADYNDRSIYGVPAVQLYESLCSSKSDEDARMLDAEYDEETAAYIARIAGFAGDENSVSVVLSENRTVMLKVSEEYLAFAKENGITDFVSFGRMKNAFVIDHIASELRRSGYTEGSIASYDGFNVNLDDSGDNYSFNLFYKGDRITNVGNVNMNCAYSLVNLRTYPIDEMELLQYYCYGDGTKRSLFLGDDCKYSMAYDNIYSYSQTKGCAEVYLSVRNAALGKAEFEASGGVDSIWYSDKTVFTTDGDIVIDNLYDGFEVVKIK